MTEASLKATLKAGGGYDAPWLTVDADNPDDLEFKLQAIANGGVPQALIEAANVLKAANNVAPLLAGGEAAAPQQAAPAPQNNGWGQAQQQAPQQQGGGGGNRFGGPPHPEGKACEFPGCGKVLEHKKTSSGKATWRCPDWRWNSGNPNGHTSEFA